LQFAKWFNDAVAANVHEPNGMSLATVSAEGRPSNRFVLLKGYDADGFKWYTNYGSRKGHDLAETGKAALAFWWPDLERQVRQTLWTSSGAPQKELPRKQVNRPQRRFSSMQEAMCLARGNILAVLR
jgi:pyridoxine/pyridoxamine 5'-phosphate oxidase